ncbi:MAG: gluconokinase [Paracoccaceae bacterium]|nr:MAG: gluconokinase [Paracoccaceae bacterium]
MRHVVVMGVCGCGKSTLGAALARHLGAVFLEGDDLHPPGNRARMAAGIPLTDADRAPWLAALADRLAVSPGPVVLSCSALRRTYRDRLSAAGPLVFVHLAPPVAVLRDRMALRQDHFMPPALLDSQLATLEPLMPDERGFTLTSAEPPDRLAAAALAALAG